MCLNPGDLVVVDSQSWPYAELRVDWLDDGCPVAAVGRAWESSQPQASACVTRALALRQRRPMASQATNEDQGRWLAGWCHVVCGLTIEGIKTT